MASDKHLAAAVLLAASVSIATIAGCQPAPSSPGGTPITPGDSPAITPITPSVQPDEPTEEPPEEEPGSDTSASPTPLPSAVLTGEQATISGVIFDEGGNRIDGGTVTAKTLNGGTFTDGSDTLAVTSNQGTYTLTGCPVGANIQITASKSGYTTRQQIIVPKADASANYLSFGDVGKDPNLIYALSAKPEVTSVTPGASATGIDPATTFTLTFNTPVNTSDVETYFTIYAAGTAGQSQTLSLPGVSLTNRYDGSKDTGGSSNGVSKVIPDTGKFLYDGSSLTPVWNDDNTKVTFTFKPGAMLPSDKDANKLPKYAISFKGAIRDAIGNSRSDQWFRLSPVQANRVGATFTVAADTTAPRVIGVTTVNNADDAGQNSGNPDVVQVQFSEPMALLPNDQDGKPIPRNASGSGYVLLNNMFKYYVSASSASELPNGMTTLPGGFAFDNASNATTGFLPLVQNGAQATWASSDATRATIQFVPLSDSPNGTGSAWSSDKADAGSSTSLIKLQNSVAGLNVGDLLQDASVNSTGTAAVYRVNAIDAANKTLTVTQSNAGGAAPAQDNVIRYWSTTTSGSGTNGATTLSLSGLSGLRKGDTLRVGAQTVTLAQDAGSFSITFTPALSANVPAGTAVTYVSPTSGVHTGFTTNYSVWVGVNPLVTDAAGNPLDTGSNGHFKKSVVP
jgi:hypothetical protein